MTHHNTNGAVHPARRSDARIDPSSLDLFDLTGHTEPAPRPATEPPAAALPPLAEADRRHLAEYEKKVQVVRDRVVGVITGRSTGLYLWARQLVSQLVDLPPAERAILAGQLAVLEASPVEPPAAARPSVQVVRDGEALRRLVAQLAGADVAAIDLKTSALDPRRGEVVGVGLAADGVVAYVPVGHRFEETNDLLPDQLPLAEVVATVRLADLPLVAHNAKFELVGLRRHAGVDPRFICDTMIAAKLLRSDLSADLEEVAVRELDEPPWALSQAELQRIAYLPIDRVAVYCGKDVRYTLALLRRQRTCLETV